MRQEKMIIDLNSNMMEDEQVPKEILEGGTENNNITRNDGESHTRKRYHRHTQSQIEELEAFFKHCPNPNVKEREELSHELGLEPLQVKFWFQNKKTQIKAQHERQENMQIQIENKKLRSDNLKYREALKNTACVSCRGPIPKMSEKEVELKMENDRLRQQIDFVLALMTTHSGFPIGNSTENPSSSTPDSFWLQVHDNNAQLRVEKQHPASKAAMYGDEGSFE